MFSASKTAYLNDAKETIKNTKVKTKIEIHAVYDLPIIRNADKIAAIYCESNGKEYEILVDDEDYYRMLCCDKILIIGLYAYVIKYKKQFAMHRFVLNYEGPKDVDHIYNDSLDNRKNQLRLATRQENLYNKNYNYVNKSSQYLGVFKNKSAAECGVDSIWVANITYNYQRIIIGNFDDEHKAGKARDMATVKYFKEFGKLNFPENIIEYNRNQECTLYIKYMETLLPGTKYIMEKNIVMVSKKKPIKYKPREVTEEEAAIIIEAEYAAEQAILKVEMELEAKAEIKHVEKMNAMRDSLRVSEETKNELKAMSVEELLASFDI